MQVTDEQVAQFKCDGMVLVPQFCYGIAHATGRNETDHDRAGLALHFLRADAAPAELIAEARDCRPYLTGPKASGGLNEYGVRVAGTWEDEVHAALAS